MKEGGGNCAQRCRGQCTGPSVWQKTLTHKHQSNAQAFIFTSSRQNINSLCPVVANDYSRWLHNGVDKNTVKGQVLVLYNAISLSNVYDTFMSPGHFFFCRRVSLCPRESAPSMELNHVLSRQHSFHPASAWKPHQSFESHLFPLQCGSHAAVYIWILSHRHMVCLNNLQMIKNHYTIKYILKMLKK